MVGARAAGHADGATMAAAPSSRDGRRARAAHPSGATVGGGRGGRFVNFGRDDIGGFPDVRDLAESTSLLAAAH